MCFRSFSDTSSFAAWSHDPTQATLTAFNTASEANSSCLVLFDLSKAIAGNGEQVLASCLKHGPAHDVARDDVQILGWIQAGWVRALAVDHSDGGHDHLLLLRNVQRTCLDQCQFGTPWRTRTAVLYSLVDTHALARMCISQNVCSWSHRLLVRFGNVNANAISMDRLSATLP